MMKKRTVTIHSDLITASALFSRCGSLYIFGFAGFVHHGFSLLCVTFVSIQL